MMGLGEDVTEGRKKEERKKKRSGGRDNECRGKKEGRWQRVVQGRENNGEEVKIKDK